MVVAVRVGAMVRVPHVSAAVRGSVGAVDCCGRVTMAVMGVGYPAMVVVNAAVMAV